MKKVSKSLGHMKAKDVKMFHIELFVEDLLETISARSAAIAVQRIKEMFRYALEKDIIYRNPAEFIKPPKFDAADKRMLSDNEKTIIENAPLDEKEKYFIFMLRYTGMRRGEILALDRADIDLNKKTIQVHKNLSENRGRPKINEHTKTSAGARTIPIFDPLYPVLEDYCKHRIGLLISNGSGNPMDSRSVFYFWDGIVNKFAIANKGKPLSEDITPHIFRHTFASDLYDAGIDLLRAQYLLGHKSSRTTLEIYTHFDKTKLKADEMNAYYKQSKESQVNTKQA
jgi:integrase